MDRVRGFVPVRYQPLLDDLLETFQDANPAALAAQVAYSLIFALPSLALFIAVVALQADRVTGSGVARSLQLALDEQVPESLRPILSDLLTGAITRASEPGPTASAFLSVVVALWASSGGFAALAQAVSRVNPEDEERSFIKNRLLSIVSVVVISLVLVGSFLVSLFGRAAGQTVAGESGARVWEWLLPPLVVAGAFVLFILLYKFGAGVHGSLRVLLPGAALATVGALLLLWFFSGYLELLDPGSAYGAAGGLIVLLLFLYLSSLLLIAGAMLSAVLARRRAHASPAPRAAPTVSDDRASAQRTA